MLAQNLQDDVCQAKMLDEYKKAYEYHMMLAEQYKQMMAAAAAKYTTNLGQPTSVLYTEAMADEMKRILKKKEDEI